MSCLLGKLGEEIQLIRLVVGIYFSKFSDLHILSVYRGRCFHMETFSSAYHRMFICLFMGSITLDGSTSRQFARLIISIVVFSSLFSAPG